MADPARAVPVAAGHRPVRRTSRRTPASTSAGRTWPAAASSTTSPATAGPTSSPRRSTPTWARRCSSTGATARSRTAPKSAGLEGQVLAVNASQADFDNDGRLDVIMVRGGWENAARLTLLRNAGDGRFEDVTVAAGLGEPIASHSAAWGDFDNDGRVDLYVCGEYATSSSAGPVRRRQLADPRRPEEPRPALSQQRRRDVQRRRREGRRPQRPIRQGGGLGRLRRRRRSRPVCLQLRRGEPAVPQQRRRDVHRRRPRAGGDRAARQLRLRVPRLRQRRPAGPVRHRLRGDARAVGGRDDRPGRRRVIASASVPQRGPGGLPRRGARRPGSIGPCSAWGWASATSTTTASSTSTSRRAGPTTRG